MRGLADLLQSGEAEPASIPQITAQIVSTADRMLELVKNLLSVNQLESGGMTFQFVEFDITPFVQSALWQYQAQAESKNITLHFASEAQSSSISADERAVMQILDNLISNAVKYSPHGKNVFVRIRHSSLVSSHLSLGSSHSFDENSPHPTKQVTSALMTNAPMTNGYVRVEVQDEGEGISPEDLKKLFGKFARLSARPTGGEHSTGLGLSIVKKMVEAMHGRVWCESEVGKGATFIVEFPSAG